MNDTNWDYSVFWDEAISQIREELSEQEYAMWFNRMNYSRSTQQQIIVNVPSSFYRDQVKQRYLPLIEQKLHELCGSRLSIDFEIHRIDSQPKTAAVPARQSDTKAQTEKTKRKPHGDLRAEYTFETFVVGQNNSFAANAAMAIAKNPGTGYNPCLIYGGVGLGKTHLIQSIGNHAHHHFDNLKIVYVTAESFTNEFIQSIREKRTHQFKNKYRYADVLLIDDIHFLKKTTETQEELFHTFNALYDANKQMVFTCDRPVSELKELTDRLRSRFERGLNVDLQPPSYETRYAILKKKIEQSHLNIPEEAVSLICANVTTNVRDLEAALTKLIAYAELVNKDITLEITQQQLKDVFASPRQSNVTVDLIQRTVADYFNLSTNDMKGKRRTKVISFPRQIAMYITREITEYSTTEVGLEFGGRDHTTVMHACQRIENRMRTDPTLEPTIQYLIRQLKEQSAKGA
jgi:chromosomal replication initiator protein